MNNIKTIAAIGKNREIGKGGTIPWYLPEDLKLFKELTLGSYCLMGRVSYEDIIEKLGEPLPNRTTLVVSTTIERQSYKNVFCFENLESALRYSKGETLWACGGRSIYAQLYPVSDELVISHVNREVPNADTFFPEFRHMIGKGERFNKHETIKKTNDFETIRYYSSKN